MQTFTNAPLPDRPEKMPERRTGARQRAAEPSGSLCISLDFELMWGVRDKRDVTCYGANILGGRDAIPRMLDMFHARKVHATWATVGLLFCETKDEMLESMPALRPTYDDPILSNYSYLQEVGGNEAQDPYYFGPSLIRLIRDCPGQEIATHTFSHYYCLEPGQTQPQFEADLDAAIGVAKRHGIEFRSIVFPRNQYTENSIAYCRRNGIDVYRGNEASWMYRPGGRAEQTLPKRAVRLADTYVNLSGAHTSVVGNGRDLTNVRSSRFLRPYSHRLRHFEPLRLSRITRSMTAAARRNETFHVWWHPHNFGANPEENLGILERMLDHFETLRSEYGMRSLAMEDFATSGASLSAK